MQNFFSHFEAIYCINLDRRNDRWEAVQREFAKVGIQDRVIRFSAIETPQKGALGCLLSHRAIIQIAKEKGYNNVLIFEDDIEFIQDNLIGPYPNLPQKWHLFYLGGGFLWRDWPFLEKSGSFFKGEGIRFSHSTAYHSDMYDILLKIPDHLRGVYYFLLRYDAIDAYLARFIQKKDTTFLYFLCRQKSGMSDIEKQEIDYSGPMDNNFLKIIHFSEYTIFLRKTLRPLFRLCWSLLWPVEVLFSFGIKSIISTSFYRKYIRPYYRVFLRHIDY